MERKRRSFFWNWRRRHHPSSEAILPIPFSFHHPRPKAGDLIRCGSCKHSAEKRTLNRSVTRGLLHIAAPWCLQNFYQRHLELHIITHALSNFAEDSECLIPPPLWSLAGRIKLSETAGRRRMMRCASTVCLSTCTIL